MLPIDLITAEFAWEAERGTSCFGGLACLEICTGDLGYYPGLLFCWWSRFVELSSGFFVVELGAGLVTLEDTWPMTSLLRQ